MCPAAVNLASFPFPLFSFAYLASFPFPLSSFAYLDYNISKAGVRFVRACLSSGWYLDANSLSGLLRSWELRDKAGRTQAPRG